MQTIEAFNIAKGEFVNTIKSLSLKGTETPISFGAYGEGKLSTNEQGNEVIVLNGSRVEFTDNEARICGPSKSIDDLIKIVKFFYDGNITIRRFIKSHHFEDPDLHSFDKLKDFLSFIGFSEWEAKGHLWGFDKALGDKTWGFYEILKDDEIFTIHKDNWRFNVKQYKTS